MSLLQNKSYEELNAEAKRLTNELTELEKYSTKLYWKKAERIYSLKKDGLFRFRFGESVPVGRHENAWGTFIKENGMSVSSSDQKVQNWEFYIRLHRFNVPELEPYDTNCLLYITTYKKNATKGEILKWIEQTQYVSREDFIEMLRGGTCLHDSTREIDQKVVVCNKCTRKIHVKTKTRSI